MDEQRERVSTTARVVRWTAASLACLLAVLMIVTATAAIFVRQQFFDTDNFVGTTSQIAREKVVRTAVEKLVMDEVDAKLDTGRLVDKATGWLESKGAPAAVEPLLEAAAASARESIEDELRSFLASDQFVEIWDAAVRRAHTAAMSVIRATGDDSVVSTVGKAVTVDLGEVVAQLKQRLLERKFELAERIPAVDATMVIVDGDVVPQAQYYAELIELAADWLPWAAVVLLIAGLVVAPDRRRGALIAGAMLTVLAGVATVAMFVVQDDVSAASANRPAVPVILEAFTGSLRDTYLTLTIVGAVLVLAAWLFGPSRSATRVRGLGRRRTA
ncbi:hypothetical protein [Stackebrandtia nassauensis]|uniref:Integral membrane protein n=1 Tax=Stackebrandtia nassauensis (strain DSM 44728 / CIP 108903 / NRRL B-16338 / NBRC 102104 / LLR-40K-21) TaxID=446470 RepID=D3PZZ3_STANL|nr:hypothetical protein [Stackebrandtia nassauensis]ADD45522.1 hypothetical protein Snas_5894 [Stackebrandtia nassauensis DSM 44728]